LHLTGNMRQYGIHVFTQSKYNSNRDLKFSSSKSMNKKELHQVISHSIIEPYKVIEQLNIQQFENTIRFEGLN